MGGSPKIRMTKAPEAPPPPPPPPTETSMDVQQEKATEKKKAITRAGKSSTFLTEQTNPAGGETVLG